MTEKHFPRLGENYREQRLPNGLLVRGIYKPEFSRIHGLVLLNVGSADTDFQWNGETWHMPSGIAHYLEHKTFDLPEGNASEAFSDLGASDNAFTTYDRTAYYFDTSSRGEECLALLLRMVFTPWFTDQTVEKEREIIAQEIRMYEDSPGSRVYEDLLARMFQHHPIRNPIAGTVDSIRDITPENLNLCHDAFYCPANAVLCVEGNLPFDRVLALAEQYTPGEYRTPARPLYGPEEPVRSGGTRRLEMDVSMPTFVIGFRGRDRFEGSLTRDFAEDLACELLCGESTPLYGRLYEENLIDGDFYSAFENLRGLSLLTVGGDSPDPEQVRRRILEEAARLCREGLDPETLARAKRAAVGARIRELDGFHNTCYRMATYALEQIEYFDFPEACGNVTEQDILDVLACVAPERTTTSVIVPREEEKV